MDVLGAKKSDGFGLVETIVGLSILAFGLLGVAAAFSQGMRSLAGSNYDILAREKAVEAIETVYSARDTKTITWAEIRNVQGETGHDGGVFLDGHHPLTIAGDDGLVNTEDDSKSPKRWCSRASTSSSARGRHRPATHRLHPPDRDQAAQRHAETAPGGIRYHVGNGGARQ